VRGNLASCLSAEGGGRVMLCEDRKKERKVQHT